MSGSSSLLGRVPEIYTKVIEHFLPRWVAEDREAANQARMFLLSHLLGPVIGLSAPLALYAFDPTPGLDILVLGASILAFWAFPFLLRRGVPYASLVVLSIANLNFAILWSCFHYGGMASPTLIWILIVPILSIFYIGGGTRLQYTLLGLSSSSFVLFLGAYVLLRPDPNDVPSSALVGLGATSTMATLCYVAVMAIYYAKIFDAGADLEAEVKRRREMAAELRRAVAEIDRAGTAKSAFLARMSHELRSPLNAIIGYGEILKEDAPDGASCRDVDRIVDAGHYLVRLINMILDLSKIEAGRMRFDLRPQDVEEVVRESAERHRAPIEAGANRLEIDLPSDLGTAAPRPGPRRGGPRRRARQRREAHAGRLREGERPPRVPRARPRPSRSRWPTPARASRPRSSRPSSRPSRPSARPRPAAMAGRASTSRLSAKLCEAMGGGIAAVSVPGEGSTFTITLPLKPEPRGRRRPAMGCHVSRGRDPNRRSLRSAALPEEP